MHKMNYNISFPEKKISQRFGGRLNPFPVPYPVEYASPENDTMLMSASPQRMNKSYELN